MANTGVRGRIVDEHGSPIEHMYVVVFDVGDVQGDDRLGWQMTPISGSFYVTYSRWAAGIERPDLVIRIYDPVRRMLYQSREYTDCTDTTLDLGYITIRRADADGWLTTLGTGSAPFVTGDSYIRFFNDNETVWHELIAAVRTANREILLQQLTVELGVILEFSSFPLPVGSPITGPTLESELLAANRRGAEVRLLLYDAAPVTTADTVRDYFANPARQPNRIDVRAFQRHLPLILHAKIVIIDGEKAFLLGSPNIQYYYDTPQHIIDDGRRGNHPSPARCSTIDPTACYAINVPVHEASLYVEGPIVSALTETFFLDWNVSGVPVMRTPTAVPPSRRANGSAQIVRSLPGGIYSGIPNGEVGILESYQRAVRYSTDLIYLENQYFTDEILAHALRSQLERNTSVQLIMVLNAVPDIPNYFAWQGRLLDWLTRGFESRIGVYTLWSHDRLGGRSRVVRNYVHSKLGIVDDRWVSVGSANLDGQSLSRSQNRPQQLGPILAFLGPLGAGAGAAAVLHYTQQSANYRSVELNASVFNGVGGQSASSVPDQIRRTLWAEHLGYANPLDSALTTRPSGGWLQLWRNRAAAKLADLALPANSTAPVHPARIVQWVPEWNPVAHLQWVGHAIGFDPQQTGLTVMRTIRPFDFNTGQWR